MTIIFEERLSDSPYIETVTWGQTVAAGSPTRPAEMNWHMVFSKREGKMYPILVGPWTASGVVNYGAGAELLWIRFKLGTYMPHLPTKKFLNSETVLPDASCKSFWLKGGTWEIPTYDNVETFIDWLVRDDMLTHDPVVTATLRDQPPEVASRTVRHRFLHSTGLSQNYIRQYERARQAADLLAQGVSILDTVFETGYYDQPHLTRSLKQFLGFTPAQHILKTCEPVAEFA